MNRFNLAVKTGLAHEAVKTFCILAGLAIVLMNFEASVFIISMIVVLLNIFALQVFSLANAIKEYRNAVKNMKLAQLAFSAFKDFLEWKEAHPDIEDDWWFENVLKGKVEDFKKEE